MHTVFSVLVLLLLTCGFSLSISIPIVDSDEAFPFLRSVDTPLQIMRWDSGMSIQLLSSCKLIRITRRGVRCISSRDHLITGWQQMFSSSKLSHINGSYPSSMCIPRNDALCVMSSGMRFFPTNTVRVADSSVNKCINGQGRTLVGDFQKQLVNRTVNINDTIDDVSLCDVLDTNLDVIYDPVNNNIFARQLSNELWLYASLSLMILAVVVLTAEAISQRTRSRLSHNLFAWLLLTGLALLMLTNIDGRMHTFVTVEDRAFVTMSFVYIVVTTLYWSFSMAEITDDSNANVHLVVSETQRDGVNAMLGSIHFATCVLYGTPDNAYVSGFFFVFLFRCLQKLHDAHQNHSKWTMLSNTVLLLDVAYTAGIFSYGVIPHFTDDTESILYAASQYVICDTLAASYVFSATTHSTDPMPLVSDNSNADSNKPSDSSKSNASRYFKPQFQNAMQQADNAQEQAGS